MVGFSPSTAMPRAVGALTVAFHDRGKLRYAGRIGTGIRTRRRATYGSGCKRCGPIGRR